MILGIKKSITDPVLFSNPKEAQVAKRFRKRKEIFEYECTITGERYKVTKKADNPDDLISVQAYYELNPEEDDRPEKIKKELELNSEE